MLSDRHPQNGEDMAYVTDISKNNSPTIGLLSENCLLKIKKNYKLKIAFDVTSLFIEL